METNNKKRKKRKTRRCLDELRKKTLNGVNDLNKKADAALHKSNNSKSIFLITRDRLTLISKAVRSETITRNQLSELENKKPKPNSATETITSNCRAIAFSPIEQNKNKMLLETRKEDHTVHNCENELFSPILINDQTDSEARTAKSAILFSSESQNDEIKSTILDCPLETSPSSASCNSNRNNDKIKTFVDIMNRIEVIIQNKIPQFLNDSQDEMKDDFSDNSYEAVETTSNESSSSEKVSHNILSPYSSPEVSVKSNSKDVLGYSWTQPSEYKTSESIQSSPIQSTSSSSMTIHVPLSSPAVSTVYDTPEYEYYPHKLN